MRPIAVGGVGFLLAVAACGGSGSAAAPRPTLTITIPVSVITSGSTAQATATASGGGAATNVQWSSSDLDVATISSTGLITGNLAGTTIIGATSGSMSAQLMVRVGPGAPARITVYSGDAQSGAKGSQLPAPLCTNVKDAAGNLIVGAVVTYTVATGGGQLAAPTSPATDAVGIATSGLWTLGDLAGTQTVTATSPGAGSVTFSAAAR